jgi:GNAT superfamily N-acetyltransferase
VQRQRPEKRSKQRSSRSAEGSIRQRADPSTPVPGSKDPAPRVVAVRADGPLLSDIIDLADSASDTLGFLPMAVFHEAARKRTLLAAVQRKKLCGYALFALPQQYIRLTQLCVAPEFRGLGLARLLITEISRLHPDRLGIKLWCRRDYPAHSMWPSLGFQPLNERRGRGKRPTELVAWWLDHGHPDLFSMADQQAVLRVSLSYDALVQLHGPRSASSHSEYDVLRQDWIADQLELVVMAEIYQAIDRLNDSAERRRLRGVASGYAQPKQDPERTRIVVDEFLKAMYDGRQADSSLDAEDLSDARLVAETALAGIRVVVTADEHMISRMSSAALRVCGVQIMHPTDVVLHLDELIRRQEYQPAELLDTEYTVTTVGPGREDELRRAFLDPSGSEEDSDLSVRLRGLAAAAPNWVRKVIRDPSGRAVAIYAYAEQHGQLAVPIVRVSSPELGETITRQLLLLFRQASRDRRLPRVCITDPHLSKAVHSAALEDGYQLNDAGLTALVIDACADAVAISDRLQAIGGGVDSVLPQLDPNPLAALAVALERTLWPAKFVDAELPTFLIPIRPTWSSLLFGVPKGLFRKPALLGISREHVYYRSPRPRVEKAPGRILWYASGSRQRLGVGAVVAYSRLEDVVVDHPSTLYQRFCHLGVWEAHQIEKVARDGRALALRFFDSEVFDQPVALKRLRELAQQHNVQVMLRSPQRIPPELFSVLYREATTQHQDGRSRT